MAPRSPRFFKHGELPLALLAILTESPRHGYDIMAELSRLFGPRYRPSPGSIYPALEALHTEGLIEGHQVGDKVAYSPTALGEQALSDRADMLGALELRVGVRLGGSDTLDTLLTRFKARLAPLSGYVDPDAALTVLNRAAREIEDLEVPTAHVPTARTSRKSHAG